MEVKREKPIEEVLDEYNISWSYGDKDKTLKTLNMFKEFIENYSVNDKYVFNDTLDYPEDDNNKESRDSYRSVILLNNPYAA